MRIPDSNVFMQANPFLWRLVSVMRFCNSYVRGIRQFLDPVGSTGYVNWTAFALIIPATLAHALPQRTLELAFGLYPVAGGRAFIDQSCMIGSPRHGC